MKAVFTSGEAKKYGAQIRKEAWSYREGARMTLTFLDKDNNQVGAMFRLTGLYDISNSAFEKRMVFVRNSDLKRLTGLPDSSTHEIIVKIDNIDQTAIVTNQLAGKLPDTGGIKLEKTGPRAGNDDRSGSAVLSDFRNHYSRCPGFRDSEYNAYGGARKDQGDWDADSHRDE